MILINHNQGIKLILFLIKILSIKANIKKVEPKITNKHKRWIKTIKIIIKRVQYSQNAKYVQQSVENNKN